MTGGEIKAIRLKGGYSQQAFAAALGVSFATVNRWENGKAKPQRDRLDRIRGLLIKDSQPQESQLNKEVRAVPRLNFEGDPEAVKLVVEANRLQNGHLFNKAFGLELSRVVPLPHQRIAVYEHLLPQNPLRFLLADDAGAGKTIMTGLYIREMIGRGRLKRVLICCPAGLTWNWQRELRHFFDLNFTILRGADFLKSNPLKESEQQLFIISVDTASSDGIRERLVSHSSPRFDLTVFDEAHKLAWSDPKREPTRRYVLAEALSAHSTHLLLLTATPHMGKLYPYFALWRLLDPKVLSTPDALRSLPEEKRSTYFVRRLKEEMVNYEGQPIYKPRLCQTVSFRLSPLEQEFYQAASDYLRWSFETNKQLNKNAAAMVVAVLQRRLASSTYAMLQSLRRRRERLLQSGIVDARSREKPSLERIIEYFDNSTADESAPIEGGLESEETFEDQAMHLAQPSNDAHLRRELEYLEAIIGLGEKVSASLQETKFLKLRELVESAELQREKLLIFTEHRDTLDSLRQRFEALGYTGQIASIHGGMDVEDRERQRVLFMPEDVRRALGIPDPGSPSARFLLATDAAGEGINLQFAWIMVNFDIPWNPARLEQRMGRLHRFGQKHSEVRIFNLIAEGTREGDVLATLLHKLDSARQELCSDKVFDIIGQQLQEISIRDLLREALYETAPYTAQKRLDSLFATQQLRATIEKLRKEASTYGDVARRLGQLNSEVEVERFNRLLPAFIQRFLESSAPRLGLALEGDLLSVARIKPVSEEGQWFNRLGSHAFVESPEYFSVRRDLDLDNLDAGKVVFMRPGEAVFDGFCQEVIGKFSQDVQRGAVFCDPTAERAYYLAIYQYQIGEPFEGHGGGGSSDPSSTCRPAGATFERRLLALRWDESSEYTVCAPNHLLALHGAPQLLSRAGRLILQPEDHLSRADRHARMLAESTLLQQTRTALKVEAASRVDDLLRGFDYRGSELAEQRADLARLARAGDQASFQALEKVKKQQAQLEEDKATALLLATRRPDLLEVTSLERIAAVLVVPDPSSEARETYDKNIEEIAMRIARSFEIDHFKSRVFDVSAPHLARGYDLESHRANGEKIVIEVKGRAGRGSIELTENEWPTAANVGDRYWLYAVVDCASEPRLYRVQDPFKKLIAKTRQSFSINLGDIIREAEND